MLNKRRYSSEIAVFDMFTDRLLSKCQWNVVLYFSTRWLSPSSAISPC